ncbi:MAG: hypothetical protein KDC65_15510, partial [Saprospiraceae bacterium]|nr:hypothetical protein [Saprospiraceae bacterium]
ESSLWSRYRYPRLQQKYHAENVALMIREYKEGLWVWDPDILQVTQVPPPAREENAGEDDEDEDDKE